MRSCPNLFRGEVAGRKTSGEASVTLRAAGKVMTEACATEELTLVEALQVREVVTGVRGETGSEEHCPALAAVVEELLQHWQALQPLVRSPEEEQQQPP